jgi:N utilization substance protein A
VGLKGVRIQAIVRELEGEKIDILKYDNDARTFIKNAMSPAEIAQIVIMDEGKRQALAIVPESQLSLAIGKQGLNVRLANRLVDWNIDVKTLAQFQAMDISSEHRRAASALFGDADDYEEEISRMLELPGVDIAVAEILRANGIELIQDFLEYDDERLLSIPGITQSHIDVLRSLIEEFEFVEDEVAVDAEAVAGAGADAEAVAEADGQAALGDGQLGPADELSPVSPPADEAVPETAAADETARSGDTAVSDETVVSDETAVSEETVMSDEADDDVYECPECGAAITTDMTVCPKCGIGLSFEYED